MIKLPLDELKDGMVLAADVLDPERKVLASEGDVVDGRVRARLERAGVRKAAVTDESAGLAELIHETERERERAGIATRSITKKRTQGAAPRKTGKKTGATPSDSVLLQERLVRVARMFNDHRDDPLMRELCRLSIKYAKEGLVSA